MYKRQARKDGDREDIVLDLLSFQGLGSTKYYALELVVYSSTGPKSVGGRGTGEVSKVGLEQPEGLR